ncbi:MAG: hypothetical protein IKL36_08310 [Clostridia bacterium]|nr:hypothetical protein [Clostridia bacterium]
MKVAIVGSRSLKIENLDLYLPHNISEIVSGRAKGIDICAREYALRNNMTLKEILPDYKRYGRGAPLKRNLEIIKYADIVVSFWDGKSKGTKYVIDNCYKKGKKITVYIVEGETVRKL